ncbi:MAG: TonB-dependent receptor [Acidobacteria bacterium]|nr:TonB-dependent receptor [Acidobacteriota bacterium]MBI3425663.1 TonB-dependent receptor [Acidobacteriota bacterium]
MKYLTWSYYGLTAQLDVGRPRVVSDGLMKCLLALLLAWPAQAVWAQSAKNDLTTTSLEELLNIEVTSVSKKEEKLFQTAAAIYVITQEDIRRSGLTSIPELLRLVPGLSVARVTGSIWAISARGFNGQYANKLLVLVDGRNTYSPIFAGVYWDEQDLPLEDIERIEVIRGPGGTLWGANAVNGVINIITKRAKDTQGGLLSTGGGNAEQGFGTVRYGGKLGSQAYYRFYAKYFNRSGLVNALGQAARDGEQIARAGGRAEWQFSGRDALTVQGDVYKGDLRETGTLISAATPFAPLANTRATLSGENVLARWNHASSPRSDTALQFYYDQTSRQAAALTDEIDTFDLDFQHHLAAGRHDLVWGLGYRSVFDETNSSSRTPVQFTPKDRRYRLFSGFVQDELTLVKERLRLTLGTKLEHNDFSGVEAQPSVRLLWTPSQRQTYWGAISRAVRTPSRSWHDVRANQAAFPGPDGTPNILAYFGDRGFKSENVLAYEIGYRSQMYDRLSLDVTAFYNRYHRLLTVVPERPFFELDPLPPHVVIPLRFRNLTHGETYGVEASTNWNITSQWKLSGSYSFLRLQLHREDATLPVAAEQGEKENPQHQFQVHSFFKLPRNFELDAALYHVSALTAQQIPRYTRLDLRLGWRVTESLDFSLGGQNLLDNRHPEFNGLDLTVVPSQIKRSFVGKATWRF